MDKQNDKHEITAFNRVIDRLTKRERELEQALEVALDYIEELMGSDFDDESETVKFLKAALHRKRK
jgi:FixJ family two-component response regulator